MTRVVINNHSEVPFGSDGVRFHTVDCPIPEGCSSATVPAGGYGEIETPQAPQAPLGLILYAPRASAASLAFQARFGLGDGSDVSTSSELPIARESQFVQTPVRFPRVLLHAGSAPVRTTLRMYGIDAKPDTRVRVELRRWHEPSAPPVATREIALPVAASDTTKPLYPAAAQLLLQQEFPFESLNGSEFAITVVPLPLPSGELPRIWAFLSITENATQDVLIQQPQ